MELYISPQGNDDNSGTITAPLATFEAARRKIQERHNHPDRKFPRLKDSVANLHGPVTVWVHGGRYEIETPISFNHDDNWPITYKAVAGEMPIVSGGITITDWEDSDVNGVRCWVTSLRQSDMDRIDGKQLFVNNQRCWRPRWPKQGTFQVDDIMYDGDKLTFNGPGTYTFKAKTEDFLNSSRVTDIDVVALHFWFDERMPVVNYDSATGIVTSAKHSRCPMIASFGETPANYFLENVFEALTEPGEFFVDKKDKKVFYVPRSDETLADMQAFIPAAAQLVSIVGRPQSPASHIRFEGITFEHSGCYDIGDESIPAANIHRNTPRFRGPNVAASPQAAIDVPGALYFKYAHDCALVDCTVRHIGWYAIEQDEGCKGIQLIGNNIHDLGAGGLKLNGSNNGGAIDAQTGFSRITDNHIHDGGHIFLSAVCILACHTHNNLIAHNHIHDFYYTAISVGWSWGYSPTVTCNNIIENNHIHHLGKKMLSDMGGIYTLGVQPGTVLRGNHIHDIECYKYGGWAIYPDEGSSHLVIENNVCHDTSSTVFHIHYGREITVRNNIFAFGRDALVAVSKAEPLPSATFLGNILITNGEPLFEAGYGYDLAQDEPIIGRMNWIYPVSGEFPAAQNKKGTGEKADEETWTWERWKSYGREIGTKIGDPKCVDLNARDFRMTGETPTQSIGFTPLDISQAGVRPKAQWLDPI